MITIAIETDNAAFGEVKGLEVARILRKMADDFEEGNEKTFYPDANGNTVAKVDEN